jgi:hypothetical protein
MKPTVWDLKNLLDMTPETSVIERANLQSHIDDRNAHPFAEFYAWQPTFGLRDLPAFPLFTVIGGGLDGSTVCESTLRREGIDVPPYPKYEAKP